MDESAHSDDERVLETGMVEGEIEPMDLADKALAYPEIFGEFA